MSRDDKAKVQTVYSVTLTKRFQYPACVIDNRNRLVDLSNKSTADFMEGLASGKVDLNEFEFNVESELPFKIKTAYSEKDRQLLDKKTSRGNVEYYIREFVTSDFVDKYGSLDVIKNPDIYKKVEEPIFAENDEDGEGEPIDYEISFYLNEECEKFWEERTQRYLTILRNKGI